MRAADRRTLAEDLDLLADHLKRVYALSVQAVHPPTFRPQLPRDISVSSAKVVVVVLDGPIPSDLPRYLDYYDIEYVAVEQANVI